MTRKPLTTKEDETPEFVAFWENWRPSKRKNDGRGDARDCFLSHVRAGADPQDIVDGAKWYLRQLTSRDKEYIPLAATWLNRRDYEDGADQERAFQEQIKQRRMVPANDARPKLPPNHFSRQWEEMQETKKKAGE